MIRLPALTGPLYIVERIALATAEPEYGLMNEPEPQPVNGPAESLPLHAEPPPLRVDEGGAVRVGRSRVSLDLVVEQYENGMTPEDMVRAYDTLALADAHAVIAYYLRHRAEVQAYLKRRATEAAMVRAKIEAERPRIAPEELLARRSAREKDNAPTGH
jgi:uncharacterized protein (DUF433 family)